MKRTGKSKIAVVGWGRGMGHTGHMYLADAVIEQAKAMKADPYFFVSKTVGKDDPIYPEEKIKIYQTVFPQYANIFMPQSDLNNALKEVAGLGYQGVVVVVGKDQKNAFQYLERPDKTGTPVYQSFGFQKLRVISRQETPSKYAKLEGPRATPMREILMKPDASEQDKFEVWRRDMPEQLSDEQVLDFMNKAEQRMKALPSKTTKLKEFYDSIKPMLENVSVEKKAKTLKKMMEIAFFKIGKKSQVQPEQEPEQPDQEKEKSLGYQHFFKPKEPVPPVPKHYHGWDEYEKENDPEQNPGVKETKSKVIARTVKDLKNPPKVMQQRSQRDKEREEQLKYRDMANRADESKDYLDEK